MYLEGCIGAKKSGLFNRKEFFPNFDLSSDFAAVAYCNILGIKSLCTFWLLSPAEGSFWGGIFQVPFSPLGSTISLLKNALISPWNSGSNCLTTHFDHSLNTFGRAGKASMETGGETCPSSPLVVSPHQERSERLGVVFNFTIELAQPKTLHLSIS